ncbi:hypothetical protein [Sphingomonas sp.]|uniref:hypothetical protein n=1 Tax=Sphingomonas sp. TaxID=28214 RepID=UPI0025E8FCFE|nr:hypothetical protein [Sphingomonas sp.]
MLQKSITLIVAAAAAVSVAAPAWAEDAATKTCKKPELRERFSIGQEDMQIIAASVQDYINCLQPQIDAKRTKAQKMLDDARAEAESANADIVALNTFIDDFKKFQLKHKDDK